MITLKLASIRTVDCVDSLLPSCRDNVVKWYDDMRDAGLIPYIYFGYRSIEQQQKLHELYMAGKGGLTAAAGQSFHNYGLAFDWVPLEESATKPEFYEAVWDSVIPYKVGEELGLKYCLRPVRDAKGQVLETGHLQDSRYATWVDAKRAYQNQG